MGLATDQGIDFPEARMTKRTVSVDSGAIAVRYGVVEVHNDHVYHIQRRLLPKLPSIWEAWLDAHWRRLPENEVRLYYNVPYRCGGFMILAYARAGSKTSLASFRTGLSVLEEIAELKRLQAIVCHATNPRLTERVMNYFGYTRHASHLKGYHYIKRLTGRNK